MIIYFRLTGDELWEGYLPVKVKGWVVHIKEKLKTVISWLKAHRELIRYVIMGGLTTVVSIGSFELFIRLIGLPWQLSKILSWILAVTFAYAGNKIYVFESKAVGKELVREIVSFFGMRIVSLGLEYAVMWVIINLIYPNESLANICATVVVMVSNYIFSKLVIFSDRKTDSDNDEHEK